MKLLQLKIFKHKEDYRPVFYSVLMAILQIAAFIWLDLFWIYMSIPVFLLLLFPIAVYNHHQQHHNSFRQAWLNRLFEMQMTFQTGIGPYAWVLHHNIGHHLLHMQHRPEENYDPSTWKDTKGKQFGLIHYCVDNLRRSPGEILKIGKKHPNIFKKWRYYSMINHLILFILIVYKPLPAIIMFFVVPCLMVVVTYLETYFHHAGLTTVEHLHSCYNYLGKFYNYITFNLGYHTAHHLNPSLHWSKLPAYHQKIQTEIPDYCKMTSRIEFLKNPITND